MYERGRLPGAEQIRKTECSRAPMSFPLTFSGPWIGSAVANPSVVNPDANRRTVQHPWRPAILQRCLPASSELSAFTTRAQRQPTAATVAGMPPRGSGISAVGTAKRWSKGKPSAGAMADRSNAREAGLRERRFRSLVESRLRASGRRLRPLTHPHDRGLMPMVSKYLSTFGSSTECPSTVAPTPGSIVW